MYRDNDRKGAGAGEIHRMLVRVEQSKAPTRFRSRGV